MAEEFIRRGHLVCGCSRSAEAARRLHERFGKPHRFDAVDVADYEAVKGWAEKVLPEVGPPDLLLNNAALINANAPLWKVPPEEFAAVMEANIHGVFHVLRCFVPAMIQQGRGVIVNFSSGWGRSTSPEVAPYCATKWAIEGLTQALAQELPAGLAAIPLNPGIIHTEMLESCFGAEATGYPSPSQWAQRAVPFLLDLGPDDNGQPLTAPE
jgi:NAD(P)-dependent dehydrogenase (short-subunit alcohol dehydrogenase family)